MPIHPTHFPFSFKSSLYGHYCKVRQSNSPDFKHYFGAKKICCSKYGMTCRRLSQYHPNACTLAGDKDFEHQI